MDGCVYTWQIDLISIELHLIWKRRFNWFVHGWRCVAGDGERGEPEPDGAVGGGPGAAMAAAAAGHELLRVVPAAPGAEQERVQPLLPQLHRRRPLRILPPRPPRPPRRAGLLQSPI